MSIETPPPAASVAEVADRFDTYASDQLASMRFQSTKREKDACRTRAAIWKDAADTLRNTPIAAPGGIERVRHVKRGTEYDVVAEGTLQTDKPLLDDTRLMAYRDDEGRWWFRTPAEFRDGRFIAICGQPGDA